MKRIAVVIMTMIIAIGMIGCGKQESASTNSNSSTENPVAESSTTEQSEEDKEAEFKDLQEHIYGNWERKDGATLIFFGEGSFESEDIYQGTFELTREGNHIYLDVEGKAYSQDMDSEPTIQEREEVEYVKGLLIYKGDEYISVEDQYSKYRGGWEDANSHDFGTMLTIDRLYKNRISGKLETNGFYEGDGEVIEYEDEVFFDEKIEMVDDATQFSVTTEQGTDITILLQFHELEYSDKFDMYQGIDLMIESEAQERAWKPYYDGYRSLYQ